MFKLLESGVTALYFLGTAIVFIACVCAVLTVTITLWTCQWLTPDLRADKVARRHL